MTYFSINKTSYLCVILCTLTTLVYTFGFLYKIYSALVSSYFYLYCIYCDVSLVDEARINLECLRVIYFLTREFKLILVFLFQEVDSKQVQVQGTVINEFTTNCYFLFFCPQWVEILTLIPLAVIDIVILNYKHWKK